MQFHPFWRQTSEQSIIGFKSFLLSIPSSASGTSAVAIDNKIEQAMVSTLSMYFIFDIYRCLRLHVARFYFISLWVVDILQDSNENIKEKNQFKNSNLKNVSH